ncbi:MULTISPECIES: hypothetical protein [Bacillus]|uniref:hypothetical protein n=1 Tax=Bacillus TaxID=1386 RepID=UPI0020405495|nr:hypothetical protein [Bacillus safensis]MCM3137344.1 hypothetical protein [Bacillus safensis]UXC31392.1 hypothetical protein N4Q31_12940 [Bacillus safensis]
MFIISGLWNFITEFFVEYPEPFALISASLIALLGVYLSIKNSSKNNRKSMIISTITKERAEWLNRLRNAFAEFNGCIYQIMRLKTKIPANEIYKSDEFSEIVATMQKTQSYIQLLLNPREKPHQILFERMEICIEQLTSTPTKYEFFDTFKQFEYVQQVILKAEWKRINKEAGGKKVNIEFIYRDVSIDINSESAKKILNYPSQTSEGVTKVILKFLKCKKKVKEQKKFYQIDNVLEYLESFGCPYEKRANFQDHIDFKQRIKAVKLTRVQIEQLIKILDYNLDILKEDSKFTPILYSIIFTVMTCGTNLMIREPKVPLFSVFLILLLMQAVLWFGWYHNTERRRKKSFKFRIYRGLLEEVILEQSSEENSKKNKVKKSKFSLFEKLFR